MWSEPLRTGGWICCGADKTKDKAEYGANPGSWGFEAGSGKEKKKRGNRAEKAGEDVIVS